MNDIFKMVKSDNKEVGIASGKRYETTAEAISDLGDETALDLIHTQDLTNRMNKIRAKYNAKPAKEDLYKNAMKSFGELPPDKIVEVSTGAGGLQAWLDEKIKELSASFDSNKELMVAECAKQKAELVAQGKEIIGAD